MTAATLEASRTTQKAIPSVPKGSSRRRKPTSARRSVSDSQTMEVGRTAKLLAAQYLSRRGYEILECDWQCEAGSADIIATDDDVLVFLNVRMSDAETGFPATTIDPSMRDGFERIALAYLSERDTEDMTVRFDVVSIIGLDSERALVRHHINALSVA